MINPFRDRLLTRHFDYFRNLITEVDDLKADLKKQSRRVKPPLSAIMSYRAMMPIASLLNKVFNGKRHAEQTSLDLYREALNKLQVLARELRQFDWERDCVSLAKTLQHICNRLFVLLPTDTAVQLELFNSDRYQSDSNKKPVALAGFQQWLQDYVLLGFKRRDVERRRVFKPLAIIQPSLRLIWA